MTASKSNKFLNPVFQCTHGIANSSLSIKLFCCLSGTPRKKPRLQKRSIDNRVSASRILHRAIITQHKNFYLTNKEAYAVYYTDKTRREHSRNVENTRLRVVFSTYLSCSQMSVVFYHSVIHGLGFFIC